MRRKLMIITLAVAGIGIGGLAILALGNTAEEEIPSGTETLTMEVQGMRTLMCEIGLKSAHLAELMRAHGLTAYHVPGGIRTLKRS